MCLDFAQQSPTFRLKLLYIGLVELEKIKDFVSQSSSVPSLKTGSVRALLYVTELLFQLSL